MEIQVHCYSGYRGEETPRTLEMGKRQVGIQTVVDRWIGPDHRYFKVQGEDDAIYILRHDSLSGKWELTFFSEREYLSSGVKNGNR